MIIALASKKFVNGDVSANLATILACISECASQSVDLLCFGEAFLHGFDGLDWVYERDILTALPADSEVFSVISTAAQESGVAVGFGYMEHDAGDLFSSYAVIDGEGGLICNFRRISAGWKEACVGNDSRYKEGAEFTSFALRGKRISVGLCGDFWYDENIEKIRKNDCDLLLWPVFVDYDTLRWENGGKREYAQQAGRVHDRVLLINSIADGPNPGLGGCFYFERGKITDELAPGGEGVLMVRL